MTTSVRASHILIKHNESRNPVSRRTNMKITKSKAEAQKEITALLSTVNQMNFAQIASEVSDCSSCTKGGDLGNFKRGAMQKPFEDAAFALTIGQISGIVDTDSGLHIIMRTA